MEDLITSLKQMAHIFNDVTDAPAGSEPLYIAAEDLKRLNIKMPQTGGREASPVKAEVIPGTGTEIPSDIKEAINRIIENTVDSKEKNETLTSVLAGSKVKFDDPVSKQLKIDKTASGQQEPETMKKAEHQTVSGNEDQRASVPRLQESIKSAAGASVEPASVEGPDSKPVPGQSDFKPAGIILEPSFENRAENTAGVELKNHSPGNSVALPNYLVDQVGKQITRAITRGDGIIRFQMKPSELGFVKLEIQMADNQISLSVTAENSTVRELMLANIRELKESLVGQGFKLGLLDIQISNDSNPFFSNSQEHFERGQNPGYEKQDQPAFFVTDEMEDSFINNNRKLRSGSTIELVA
jgi:flagellar hook-length control protein FliK